MRTLKSPTARKWRGANSRHALARRAAAADERRKARPVQRYEYAPGSTAMRITIEAPGWAISALLLVPLAHMTARSDQHIVEIDGQRQPELMGVSAVLAELRKRLPRRLNRRALATMGPNADSAAGRAYFAAPISES